jgi:hypothetical protein
MASKTVVRMPEGREFAPAPEGLHQAVCVDVWEIWTEKRPEHFGGGLVDKTRLVWQLDKEDKDGRRFEVMGTYTASLHEKAKLRQHLESWRGRRFTDEELKGFELEQIVGVNCQIQVVHNVSANGKVYANVQAIVPLGKGQVKIRPEDFVRRKDRMQPQENTSGNGSVESDDDVPF